MQLSRWFPVAVVVLMLAAALPGQAQGIPDEATRDRVADWIQRCDGDWSGACGLVDDYITERSLGRWCRRLEVHWDTPRLVRSADVDHPAAGVADRHRHRAQEFLEECVPIYAAALARAGTAASDRADAGDAGPRDAGPRWEVVPADRVMQAAKRSNLRSGPGTEHDKVGLLEVGEQVRVTGEVGNWLRIEAPGGGEAFIYGPLLAEAAPDEVATASGEEPAPSPDTVTETAAATPAANCKDWNTSEFFGAATPAISTRCLRAGADPNARDRDGRTPLHWAAGLSGNPAVIDVLVEAGADPDARDENQQSPLHAAARFNGDPTFVTLLLEAGADLDARGKFGGTPLHVSIWNEDVSVMRTLLKAGADPNAGEDGPDGGNTPLHYAARYGNPAMVAVLLAAGADPNARNRDDRWGNTPLDWALEDNNRAVADLLLKGGETAKAKRADPNAPDQGDGVLATGPNVASAPGAGTGPLHGSIAFSQDDDGAYAWGIAWSFDSAAGAQSEALGQCREYGGTQCAQAGWFQEACGALAIGSVNGYGTGWGATMAEAERDALAQCRAVNDDCRIEVARCSRSEEAGGRGRTENMDTAVDHAPADAPPSDNSEQACDAWEASYTQTWTEEGLQRGGINLTEAESGFATKAEAEDFVQRICDSRHMAYGPGAGVDYVLESCTVGEARCVQPRSHAQQPGPPGEAPDPDDARPSDNSEQGCDNWAEPPWDEC